MRGIGLAPQGPGLRSHGRWSLSGRGARRVATLSAFAWALAHPLPAAKEPLDIPYFLAVDLSQLDISVTTTTVGKVKKVSPSGADGSMWEFTRSVAAERVGELGLKTVADRAAQRSLRLPKAVWSDVDATVELTEGGLLAGINASAAGRGDDFLLAVAKFAGVAAGFGTGGAATALTGLYLADLQSVTARSRAFRTSTAVPAGDCADLEGVPVEMEAFVRLDPAGCPAFTKLREATANVEAKRIRRDILAEQVPGTFGAELTEVNRKLQSYRQEVAYAEAVEAQRRATLTTLFERFARERCLGPKVASATFRELLALDHVPSAEGMRWLGGAELSRDAVKKALEDGKWSDMLDLFERTGLVATIDGAPAPPRSPTPPSPPASEGSASDPSAEIVWRQAVPVRLRIWALAGGADEAKAVGDEKTACGPEPKLDPDKDAVAELAFDGIVDVLHPRSPIRALALETSVFADRSLAVTFDSRGRPRKIDTSGSSSSAGFAQAAAAAAQGFRDEYDATLKKRVSIEESKRELAIDGWNDRIAALEAQKKELDARAELLGASGSFDDLVARQKLDSELKLLEAQVALRMAEATAEQRVAIAELEKRVLETQKRLALLEAEQALDEARRKR